MRHLSSKLLCLAISLTMIISLAGCGNVGGGSASATEPASSGAAAEGGVTVVDQDGREVVIDGPVEKIVSGYYISSSACIALGLADKLAGIEAKADSRPIYSMAAPQLLELPSVGTAKEFNMEGCLALEPDLVILPKRLRDSADTMEELGIPVILVSPESHQELVDMITLIGRATGAEDNAAKLIAYYNAELAAVAELTKDITERPSVYMGGNSAYLTAAPKDMYQASLIQAGGGVNAAGEIDGDNWAEISYEQIIAMNPDVIVIPSEADYSREDVAGDPQLADITAVKEDRIYQMPKDFEAWDSPVPSCTLGVRWMLSALHGDVYPMEALGADAVDFYSEFYGAEIDPSRIGK